MTAKRRIEARNQGVVHAVLVQEPVLVTTSGGVPKATVRVAIPRPSYLPQKRRKVKGRWVSVSDYATLVVLGKDAVRSYQWWSTHPKAAVEATVACVSDDVDSGGRRWTKHELLVLDWHPLTEGEVQDV